MARKDPGSVPKSPWGGFLLEGGEHRGPGGGFGVARTSLVKELDHGAVVHLLYDTAVGLV